MSRLGSRILFTVSLLTFASAGALVWGSYEFIHQEFPEVGVLKTQFPVVHYHGKDQPATITLTRMRPSSWVSLGEVSKVAVGAILVSEDWAFYQHKGYDANQIKEAIREDWEEPARSPSRWCATCFWIRTRTSGASLRSCS